MSDISGISGYADLITANAAQNVSTNSIKGTLNSTGETSSSDELLDACKEFEAYLWEQVFKSMEKTAKVFSDDDGDSYSSGMVDLFKSSTLQEITGKIAADGGSQSLANVLYEQMKRNYNITDVSDTEKNAAATQTVAVGTETDYTSTAEEEQTEEGTFVMESLGNTTLL